MDEDIFLNGSKAKKFKAIHTKMTETDSGALLETLEGMERIARRFYSDVIDPLDPALTETIQTLAESELVHFERSGYSDGEKLGVGLQIVATICEFWAEKLRDGVLRI